MFSNILDNILSPGEGLSCDNERGFSDHELSPLRQTEHQMDPYGQRSLVEMLSQSYAAALVTYPVNVPSFQASLPIMQSPL